MNETNIFLANKKKRQNSHNHTLSLKKNIYYA